MNGWNITHLLPILRTKLNYPSPLSSSMMLNNEDTSIHLANTYGVPTICYVHSRSWAIPVNKTSKNYSLVELAFQQEGKQ